MFSKAETSPSFPRRRESRIGTYWPLALLLLVGGCAQEMMNQRRVESQEQTVAFADGMASRPLPQHTVPSNKVALGSISGGLSPLLTWAKSSDNEVYWEGKSDGVLVDYIPEQVLDRHDLRKLIERGQQRFDISCAPCHDRTGSGNGMVARRGYKYPPSYHTDSLRSEPIGFIFNIATHGRGQMPGYGDFISADDRWAIAAYVRTLQFSQYAPASELSDADLDKLNSQPESAKLPSKASNPSESTSAAP